MLLDERNVFENCGYELVDVARNSNTAAYTTTAPQARADVSFVLVRAPYFPLPATSCVSDPFPFNKERISHSTSSIPISSPRTTHQNNSSSL
jgi:hypothetical protein